MASDIQVKLADYFRQQLEDDSKLEAKLAWRLFCYKIADSYLDFIEENYFPIAGKHVLDVACAWGGHAVRFAERGAVVSGSDLNDHDFLRLNEFADSENLSLTVQKARCENIPHPDASFDVIFALDLIEHIPSTKAFSKELARVLKPGGVCIVTTPSRLRSFIFGEPHYHLPLITAVPFRLQARVAEKIFKKSYPFPIERQYFFSKSVVRAFYEEGFSGRGVIHGRIAREVGRIPGALRFLSAFYWDFIVLEKS